MSRSRIKVETGGVECVPSCLPPARSSAAATFNPYFICSLLLLLARARPSKPGWACPRLPAVLACAATLRPRDRAGRWAAASRRTHWLSRGPRSVTRPTAALCCPARALLAQGGLWDAALHAQAADWTLPRAPKQVRSGTAERGSLGCDLHRGVSGPLSPFSSSVQLNGY